MAKPAAEFIAVMLHSATATHFMHLATKSYAEHVALAGYYDAIVELVDQFAETFQGRYGVISLAQYPNGFKVPEEPVKYAETLQSFVRGTRENLPEDTDLQNIVDEIQGEVTTLLYKLKNLK